MLASARYMPKGGAGIALASLMALGGCNMHREGALRSDLSAWFQLGDTLAFESRRNCTAAVFRARNNSVSPDLALKASPPDAQDVYRTTGLAAIAASGASPHDLTDAMLLTPDGAFGKQALAAAALVGPCLDTTLAAEFGNAMTRRGALLAYSAELGGVMVLDHDARKLFFAAGDPL